MADISLGHELCVKRGSIIVVITVNKLQIFCVICKVMCIYFWRKITFMYGNTIHLGCAVAHAVSCLPLTMEGWLWSCVSPYGICGGSLVFTLSSLVFPCHHSIILHSHVLFIYHRYCIILVIDSIKEGTFLLQSTLMCLIDSRCRIS
jgi:hypothetical protein